MGKGRGTNGATPPNNATDSALETAAYIAQMSAELAALAQDEQLHLLAYLLKMAAEEARQCGPQPKLNCEA